MKNRQHENKRAAKEMAKDRYQFQWWALSLIHARPVGSTAAKRREGKKGADDGLMAGSGLLMV